MKRFRFRLTALILLLVFVILLAIGCVYFVITDEQIVSIGAPLLIGFVIIGVGLLNIVQRLTSPLEDAIKVAKELAEGNFKVRTFDHHLDETGQLNQAINALARNLETMTKSVEAEKSRLYTLVENMGSGVLLIDARGYVTFINRAYKKMFFVKGNEWESGIFYDVLSEEGLVHIIDETFLTEQKLKRQWQATVGIERKYFDVESTPIISPGKTIKGIVVVLHDITELKKLEQTRKDFVSNVSHELKTPVTSLKGFAETLLEEDIEDEALRTHFTKIILKESERLQSLIQDLLDLSKMEQDHFELFLEEVDLKALLEETIFMLESRAREKNIELNLEAENQVMIFGDPSRLKQIFINLLINSLTYTPDGGKITLTLREKTDTVDFSITDTGIGIKKSEIPRIFERFYRVDKARSRESGGTGLGLAIVKHLVEAHNGSISVQSTPGVGTTFRLSFPK